MILPFPESQQLMGNGILGGLNVQEVGFGGAGLPTLRPPLITFFFPLPPAFLFLAALGLH